MITSRRVPFDPVATKCSAFYNTFTPDIYGDAFCQFGVYVYNGWKSAYAVPLLVQPDAQKTSGLRNFRKLDVDYWVTKPADVLSRTWIRVLKEYTTCAVLYYASIPANTDGVPGYNPVSDMKVEDVGDILYMKLVDGEIVDVEDEEVNDVLLNIVRYL
ncbi:hypothetical protein F5887DRAFT_1075018 [Amanita rubescens]|nr:hypothetical protein F5887DRAFT_1075018 [Amanita rubescens]